LETGHDLGRAREHDLKVSSLPAKQIVVWVVKTGNAKEAACFEREKISLGPAAGIYT
jgi:hypothetical protein